MVVRNDSHFTVEKQLSLLELMLESRHGDLRQESLNRQGKGHFHVSGMGHEAMAVLGSLMQEGDMSSMYYRDRAFMLGLGIKTKALALDYFAKRDSSTAGRQMPAHSTYREHGFWSVATPTGAQLLPGCGLAWGMQLDKRKNLVVTSIGDAATRQGDFYEAICFALERTLPMLFVVEDNGYGISTPTREINPLAIGALPSSQWHVIDGSDVRAVYAHAVEAMTRLRAGEGPVFFWFKFERLSSHTSSDDQKLYRSEEELTQMDQRDPILVLRNQLIEEGHLTSAQYEKLDREIKERVREEYAAAERAADPNPADLLKDVLGPEPKLDSHYEVLPKGKYRMGDSVNLALNKILKEEPNAILFGEDIEDPKGGVFRLTKGLSTQFKDRVFNSPLAESTILGVACGLASYGKRPVFELQFIDFIAPGWNQLVTNFSTLRWRSNGEWKCPVVIYAPCGAYLPGGSIWHSQTNEAALAHYPGIRVVMPSTPEDAAGLFWTASKAEDPTIILLPKHLLWVEHQLPDAITPVPFGKARCVESGDQVTLVCWGNTVEIGTAALQKLDLQGAVDFIDLRSIVPWDRAMLVESLKKTGRLVVVQEDTENCSIGQMLVSSLMEDTAVWPHLKAPPTLVTKSNVLIGYNPILEFAALPDIDRVVEALKCSLKSESLTQFRVTSEAPNQMIADQAPPSTASSTMPSQSIPIRVPQLGEGIRAGRIVSLLKQPGESIAHDDALCELETDKAIYPIESSCAGTLEKWEVAVGDSVEIGTILGSIQSEDAVVKEAHLRASNGSEIAPALSPAITKRLGQVVPVYLSVNANWSAIRAARAKAKKDRNAAHVTPSLILAWCVVRATESNKLFRRQYVEGSDRLMQLEDFDLGIAVALEEDRLMTAIIPNANTLKWEQFIEAYRQAIKEARAGKSYGHIQAPVILTSLGGYGVRTGQPLLVPPAVGTLFVGEAHHEAAPKGESAQEVVSLCLTFDHRVINGAGGAAFIQEVKRLIEHFRMN